MMFLLWERKKCETLRGSFSVFRDNDHFQINKFQPLRSDYICTYVRPWKLFHFKRTDSIFPGSRIIVLCSKKVVVVLSVYSERKEAFEKIDYPARPDTYAHNKKGKI